MREIIRQGLIEMGLERRISPIAPEHLTRYGLMLLEKNAVMNLTAITNPDDVARLHMLDCAAVLNCCDLASACWTWAPAQAFRAWCSSSSFLPWM